MTVSQLLEQAQASNRRSLARLLSYVEKDRAEARELSKLIEPSSGSWLTGITGAPGAGKSTLVGSLLGEIRKHRASVAVIAVDPSSPYSGGAILGDRVRMGSHTTDEGVFIRSVASRGHSGGLSIAVPESVRVFQACGFPEVLVETVGVGQIEVEIASEADTTVVVVNPGWGDSIQASKAGLMEIADIFVVNKADRPGAAETERDLRSMLAMSTGGVSGWRVPVVRTDSISGEGIAELWQEMRSHRDHWSQSPGRAKAIITRREHQTLRIVAARQKKRSDTFLASDQGQHLLRDLSDERVDPWEAAEIILKGY